MFNAAFAAAMGFMVTVHGAQARMATPPELGPDLSYVMSLETFEAFRDVPGSDSLENIVTVGARALEWVDVMQKDVAPESREQVWRRSDRIGHEPSPDKPLIYNPELILDAFRKTMAETPESVRKILDGRAQLPARPPEGLSVKEVVGFIRPLNTIYSRASRWLALYQWKNQMPPEGRDMRGWLRVRRDHDALVAVASRWEQLTESERTQFVDELAEACLIATHEAPTECRRGHDQLRTTRGTGAEALAWLNELLAKGQAEYDWRFVVQANHPNAKLSDGGGRRMIGIPATGIEGDMLAWLVERINEAWTFNDAAGAPFLGVNLYGADASLDGALKVEWEKGALPHVNGIAGDTITMDANEPRWLEQVQVTMRHEFGHVLGFPDCYSEFWDENRQAFVDYALDPDNAMCALSGRYLDIHRDALAKAYLQ